MLTSTVAKINNALQLNCIEPEIEKILRKNQNGFQRKWSTTSQTLTIHWFIGVCVKNLLATLICRFLKGVELHTQKEDGANTTRV